MRSVKCTYESVSSAFASLSVSDNNRFVYLSVWFKESLKRVVCRVVGQTADEDLREGRVLLLE